MYYRCKWGPLAAPPADLPRKLVLHWRHLLFTSRTPPCRFISAWSRSIEIFCVMEIVEDIEDLLSSVESVDDRNQVNTKKYVYPKVTRRKIAEELPSCDSIIPGTQRVYLKTWGCSHNNSDSEYMAGQLAEFGYSIVDAKENADVWVLNSCTVKDPAEAHLRNTIEDAEKCNKKVVVAGCVSQGAPNTPFLNKLSIVGVHQIDRVVEVVEETLKGNCVRLLSKKKQDGRRSGGASLALPKIRRNALIEIIPINTGCLNQCTYCKTKHARGELGSYPVEEIVSRAKQAIDEGVCEIWLTSEDTGAYGRDIGTSLPQLLSELVPVIPEGCRIRVGMTNPPYILEHLEAMAELLANPRLYAFLHVPVQSGSDFVLADMKREYCIEDFERVVTFLRERVPGITIATDIICGFPTETEEDFSATLSLVEKYRFPSLFINQFYPRPGTPAARMQRVPTQEVKRRTKRLSQLFESYFPYENRVGCHYDVLVTEIAHDKIHFVGHNQFYEQVLVPKDEKYWGKIVSVRIESCGKHYMVGRPIEGHVPVTPCRALQPKGKENLVSVSYAVPVVITLVVLTWLYQKLALFY